MNPPTQLPIGEVFATPSQPAVARAGRHSSSGHSSSGHSSSGHIARGRRQWRRGAAAAELAATLPLLILLFLGACDLGRFGHVQSAVISSARAGAGQGILNPPTANGRSRWEAEIRRAVVEELSGLNAFDPDRLSVSSICVRETSGAQRVSVQVTYEFHTLVTWGVIPHQLPLRQTSVLRML